MTPETGKRIIPRSYEEAEQLHNAFYGQYSTPLIMKGQMNWYKVTAVGPTSDPIEKRGYYCEPVEAPVKLQPAQATPDGRTLLDTSNTLLRFNDQLRIPLDTKSGVTLQEGVELALEDLIAQRDQAQQELAAAKQSGSIPPGILVIGGALPGYALNKMREEWDKHVEETIGGVPTLASAPELTEQPTAATVGVPVDELHVSLADPALIIPDEAVAKAEAVYEATTPHTEPHVPASEWTDILDRAEALGVHLHGLTLMQALERVLDAMQDSSEAETAEVLRDHPDVVRRITQHQAGGEPSMSAEAYFAKRGIVDESDEDPNQDDDREDDADPTCVSFDDIQVNFGARGAPVLVCVNDDTYITNVIGAKVGEDKNGQPVIALAFSPRSITVNNTSPNLHASDPFSSFGEAEQDKRWAATTISVPIY